jgi:hypothetical protein
MGSPEAKTAPPGTPVLVAPMPFPPESHLRADPWGLDPSHGHNDHPGVPLPVGEIQPPMRPLISQDTVYVDDETGQQQEGI